MMIQNTINVHRQTETTMLAEAVVAPITEIILGWMPQGTIVHNWLHSLTLQVALRRAYYRFADQYPEWAASLFDGHFLSQRAAPLVAGYFEQTTLPSPAELAIAWDEQLGLASSAVRERRIAELTVAATDFLNWLTAELHY
jgi:hypothetical protein